MKKGKHFILIRNPLDILVTLLCRIYLYATSIFLSLAYDLIVRLPVIL